MLSSAYVIRYFEQLDDVEKELVRSGTLKIEFYFEVTSGDHIVRIKKYCDELGLKPSFTSKGDYDGLRSTGSIYS